MNLRPLCVAFQIAVFCTMGFVQYHAALDGLRQWLGYEIAEPVALAFGWMPVIGTALAVAGATTVSGWELWQAAPFFSWHLITLAIIFYLQKKRAKEK